MSLNAVIPYPPQGCPAPPCDVPNSCYSDPPTFRSHFAEFADDVTYPDSSVQFFLNVGSALINARRWGNMTCFGVELICAHFLAMQQYAQLGAAGGGVPGLARGIMQNKSVSKVSVGYNTEVTAVEGWGPWNLTVYGQMFADFADMFGRGGIELLSIGYENQLAGIVWTWARGVLNMWNS